MYLGIFLLVGIMILNVLEEQTPSEQGKEIIRNSKDNLRILATGYSIALDLIDLLTPDEAISVETCLTGVDADKGKALLEASNEECNLTASECNSILEDRIQDITAEFAMAGANCINVIKE